MGSRASNRSFETAGLEDESQNWMQRHVRVKSHPEWGIVRVLRWFPGSEQGAPATVRIFGANMPVPVVLPVDAIEIVAESD